MDNSAVEIHNTDSLNAILLDPPNKSTVKHSIRSSMRSSMRRSLLKTTPAPWNTTAWRWLALILMNLLLLGDYVVIDSPQALETQIKEALNIDTQTYSYLYSSWALPSIVVPFVGGYLTDYLGVRPTLVIASVILTIGQLVYLLGAQALDFGWMLGGRAIYALGSNPINVAQIVIIFKWFQGREMALAMAISSTTSCVGRALNSFAVPKVYDMAQTLGGPIMFGLIICGFSTVACVIMVIWDKFNDKRLMARDPDFTGKVPAPEKVSIKDIRHFKLAVWLLVLNFGLTDGYFFSFNAFSNDFYHIRYEFTNSAAGDIISLNYLVGAISSVVFGILVDRKAFRASIIFYSSLLGVFAFLYYYIVPVCPECLTTMIPQILFGLQIGINDAATFPSLPLILEEKYLGTGYGFFFVIQNTLLFVLPPLGAFIRDNTAGMQDEFFWMLIFFFGLACFTAIESFAVLLKDRKMERILDKFIMKDPEEEYDDDEEEDGIEEEGGEESGEMEGVINGEVENKQSRDSLQEDTTMDLRETRTSV